MLILKNARLIPELTEDWSSESGDIVIEDGVIREIKAAGTAEGGAAEQHL